MTRIVRSTYRYRPPPRRKKAVPLEVPAVLTISEKTRRRTDRTDDTTDKTKTAPPKPTPANDDRKSAVVTARRPGKRYVDVPEMTEEEHRATGDRADAMMQEFKRRIAEKLR